MRKFLTLCGILLSLSVTAQWQQTGSKVRYVNGIGIPTKDTAAGVLADSSQIVIRPADSSLYRKYKRTWRKVGGSEFTGSGTGSSTSGFLPRWSSSTSLDNSVIYQDNSGNLGLGTAFPNAAYRVTVAGSLVQTLPPTTVENTVAGTTVLITSTLVDFGAFGTKSNHHLGFVANNDVKASITPTGQFNIGGNYTSTNNTLQVTGNAAIGYTTAAPANGLLVAGNVGIGVTPSAWGSIFQPVQIGTGGSLFGRTSANQDVFQMGANVFWDGTNWKYIANGFSTRYEQATGTHSWHIAPSGTAGGTISYTQAMTMLNNGNVGIGDAGAANRLTVSHDINGSARLSLTNPNTGTSAESYIYAITTGNRYVGLLQHGQNKTGTTAGLSNASLSEIQAGADNSALLINQGSVTAPMVFATNNAERIRITSGGEVLVGNTDNGAYNLQCNGTGVWGAGAYVNGSDSALKDSVIDLDNALDLVMKMKPKTYKYREFYNNSNSVQTGFIAQDLEEVLKDKVYKDGIVISGGKYKGVAYEAIIPLLVKTIQEQQSQIDDIKKQIEELKKLIK
jgi:hypothetical protein